MVSRKILEALPDWFGIPQAREEYIAECVSQQFYGSLQVCAPASNGFRRGGWIDQILAKRLWCDLPL